MTLDTDMAKKLEKEHIMQSYKRYGLILESGKGCSIKDNEGKEYLDCVGGLATCPVGHANEKIIKTVTEQAKKIICVSNLYFSEPQITLAQKLSQLSGLQKCFFCNSGSEANEAAIKLAKKITGKKKFIAFKNAFHGRTTASLAATWKGKFKEMFAPLAPEVIFIPLNDSEALEKAMNGDIAGVIIEPIQGEAGIRIPESGFLKEVKRICEKHNVLFIVDEVQSGMGRTGTFFAYEQEDIVPDIVTLAKGLANGIPIGACLSNYEFEKSEHGSTFGGNPLSCAAAIATINIIENENLAGNAKKMGEYIKQQLEQLKKDTGKIQEIRAKGLMIGITLSHDNAEEILMNCIKNGLLINHVSKDILRLLPPLTISKEEIDNCIMILSKVLR